MTLISRLHPGRLWSAPRRRIGARLALSYAFLCLLLLAIGLMSIWQARGMHARIAAALDGRVAALVRLQGLDREVQQVNLAARDALLSADEAAAVAALARIEQGRGRIGSEIEALQKTMQGSNDPAAPVVEELAGQSSGVLVALLKLSRQIKGGQADAAKALLFGALIPKMNGFAGLIAQAQGVQLAELERTRTQATESASLGERLTALVLAVAVLAAALLARRITVGITRPVTATAALAQRIAAGDLSQALAEPVRSDELGMLQHAMLDMQRQLSELVSGIRHSADGIAEASEKIAGGGHHLSQRTEEAAGSLQRTALAMNELAQTVGQSAESARSAGTMMDSASQAAERGGQVVAQVVERMGEIATASNRIADITGVIDGIAFQTNILALNAAVEAARAGEHGRGFAVVASEVRALAQRSSVASREIKGLIGDSVAKVAAGSRLVEGAGATMREIVADVGRVSGVVSSICTAAASQSEGLGEVNSAVHKLDDTTRQNAALVEQSTAAAESLREEAQGLQQLVNRFQLAPDLR
jgi:methyl-accepting chemotaxis protein